MHCGIPHPHPSRRSIWRLECLPHHWWADLRRWRHRKWSNRQIDRWTNLLKIVSLLALWWSVCWRRRWSLLFSQWSSSSDASIADRSLEWIHQRGTNRLLKIKSWDVQFSSWNLCDARSDAIGDVTDRVPDKENHLARSSLAKNNPVFRRWDCALSDEIVSREMKSSNGSELSFIFTEVERTKCTQMWQQHVSEVSDDGLGPHLEKKTLTIDRILKWSDWKSFKSKEFTNRLRLDRPFSMLRIDLRHIVSMRRWQIS